MALPGSRSEGPIVGKLGSFPTANNVTVVRGSTTFLERTVRKFGTWTRGD